MSPTQKSWLDHLKSNMISLILAVGSLFAVFQKIDAGFINMQRDIVDVKVDLSGLKEHQKTTDAKVDTLAQQIRDMRNSMKYPATLQVKPIQDNVAAYTEKREFINGQWHIKYIPIVN